MAKLHEGYSWDDGFTENDNDTAILEEAAAELEDEELDEEEEELSYYEEENLMEGYEEEE